MGFVKSFAKTVSDIVDVELQILPSLIGGLLTGGVGGLLLSGALSSTQAVLSRISPEEFKAEGFTIEQQRAVNFLRAEKGLPLVGKFGQELRGFVEVLARSDFERAIEAAKISRTPVGIESTLPAADPRFLVDNPFLSRRPSNLSVRIPDTTSSERIRPPTGGGLVLDVPITIPGVVPAQGQTPPSQRGGPRLPVGPPPLPEAPMGFFETLGDRIVAAAPDILRGFATGGFSGGFSAAGLAAVGGAPAGFGGEPPRIQRAQAETRQMISTADLRTPRPPIGTVPVGFGSMGGPIARSFDPRLPVGRRMLGVAGVAGAVGGVFQRVPDISGERFGKAFAQSVQGAIGPFPSGPLPPGPPPPGGQRVMGFADRPAVGFQQQEFPFPPVPRGGAGMAGRSNFAKDECNRTLKFFCSPRPGEGWVNVMDAAKLGLKARKPFARFNLMEQRFERIPRRRMNIANMKALGRAERRRRDFMDLVLPLIRDRRKEQAGTRPRLVVAKRRKKKRKVA